MTFPAVLSITPSSFNVNATSHLVAMPATVEIGDLLLVLFSNDAADLVTTPSGWSELYTYANGTAIRFGTYAKVAIGDEGGTTVDFVTETTEMAAAQVYRIQAGTWYGALTGIESSTPILGTTPYCNPPSFAPSWGALDTLWIACYGADDDDDCIAYPTNYTNGIYTESGTANGSVSIGSARRELNATSDNPSSFQMAASEQSLAYTIAIQPADGAAYYHGLKVQGEGELALCDAGSHPLRIRKGGTTYGIELVATDDPNASRLRIKTPAGIKAIRRYT